MQLQYVVINARSFPIQQDSFFFSVVIRRNTFSRGVLLLVCMCSTQFPRIFCCQSERMSLPFHFFVCFLLLAFPLHCLSHLPIIIVFLIILLSSSSSSCSRTHPPPYHHSLTLSCSWPFPSAVRSHHLFLRYHSHSPPHHHHDLYPHPFRLPNSYPLINLSSIMIMIIIFTIFPFLSPLYILINIIFFLLLIILMSSSCIPHSSCRLSFCNLFFRLSSSHRLPSVSPFKG